MTKLDELESLAKKATPGPWNWNQEKYTYKRGKKDCLVTPLLLQSERKTLVFKKDAYDDNVLSISWPSAKNQLQWSMSKENREYIAAADPTTILELFGLIHKLMNSNSKAISLLHELSGLLSEVSKYTGNEEMISVSKEFLNLSQDLCNELKKSSNRTLQ